MSSYLTLCANISLFLFNQKPCSLAFYTTITFDSYIYHQSSRLENVDIICFINFILSCKSTIVQSSIPAPSVTIHILMHRSYITKYKCQAHHKSTCMHHMKSAEPCSYLMTTQSLFELLLKLFVMLGKINKKKLLVFLAYPIDHYLIMWGR